MQCGRSIHACSWCGGANSGSLARRGCENLVILRTTVRRHPRKFWAKRHSTVDRRAPPTRKSRHKSVEGAYPRGFGTLTHASRTKARGQVGPRKGPIWRVVPRSTARGHPAQKLGEAFCRDCPWTRAVEKSVGCLSGGGSALDSAVRHKDAPCSALDSCRLGSGVLPVRHKGARWSGTPAASRLPHGV